MGTFRSLLILGAGVVIGGAALIAYRISQETGKPLQDALLDVPAEAGRVFTDLKSRAAEAVERGREIYEERQTAFEEPYEGQPAAE
jgi:hypothetical protein